MYRLCYVTIVPLVASSTTSCLFASLKLLHLFGLLELQQVNLLKEACPPPQKKKYPTECHYVCYMTRIICTYINSCNSCRYNIYITNTQYVQLFITYYMFLYMLAFAREHTKLTTQCVEFFYKCKQ